MIKWNETLWKLSVLLLLSRSINKTDHLCPLDAHLVNFRAELIDSSLQFLVLLLQVVESQVDHVKYLDPVVFRFCLHRAVDGFTVIDVNVILRNYELLPTQLRVSRGKNRRDLLPGVCPWRQSSPERSAYFSSVWKGIHRSRFPDYPACFHPWSQCCSVYWRLCSSSSSVTLSSSSSSSSTLSTSTSTNNWNTSIMEKCDWNIHLIQFVYFVLIRTSCCPGSHLNIEGRLRCEVLLPLFSLAQGGSNTVIWLGGHNARQRPARWPDRPRNTTMTAWADQPSEDITTNQHDRQRYVLPKKMIPLHNDPSWTVAIGHQPTSIECRHIWTHGPFVGEREKKLIIFNILLTGLSYPSSSPHRTFCFLATQNFFMNFSFPLKRVLKLL